MARAVQCGRANAGYWQSLGVKSGDTVGCLTDKSPEAVVAFLACARLGAVFCPINFKLNGKHICDQIETANVSVVLTQQSRQDVLDSVSHAFRKPPLILSIDSQDRDGFHGFWPHEDHPKPSLCRHPILCATSTIHLAQPVAPKEPSAPMHTYLSNARDTISGLGFGPSDVFLGMFWSSCIPMSSFIGRSWWVVPL